MALLIGLFALVTSILVASRTKGPHIRSAIFHPVFFVGFFSCLVGLDFFVLDLSLQNATWVTFATFHLQGQSEFSWAVIVFAIMTAASLGGYTLGLGFRMQWPVFGKFVNRYESYPQATKVPLLIFVAMAAWFVLVPLINEVLSRGILAIAGLRQVFLGESLIYYLVTLCIVPSFFIFCSDRRPRWILIAASILLCIFFVLIGTRGSVVMVALGLVTAIYHHRKVRLGLVLVVGFAVIWIGYLYTYATRFQHGYSSLAEFRSEMGGPFDYIMNSSEMSIAESMMLHLNQHSIDRGPLDSFLGALFAFVPRDLIPWKPMGFSTHMTSHIDMDRWLLVKSEWTVSGYVNVVYEMGVIGGALANFALFCALGALFRGARDHRAAAIFAVCCQIYLMLGYLRSDIHNLGVRAWAILVVLVVFKLGLHAHSLVRPAGNKNRNWEY